MKLKTVICFMFLFFIKIGIAQKIGFETGIGVNAPHTKLLKVIPLTNVPVISSTTVNLYTLSYLNFQFPSISVYYKTLNNFKASFYFQHTISAPAIFERVAPEDNYYVNYVSSSNDLGLNLQQPFFQRKALYFSLNAMLNYKTKFKMKSASYESPISTGYDVLDEIVSNTGQFFMAGGGLGLHYKNITLVNGYFQNISRIQKVNDPYIKKYYGYYMTLNYSFLSRSLKRKEKRENASFYFGNSAKNKLFFELSQNAFNWTKSTGVVAYYENDPTRWTNSVVSRRIYIFDKAPKILSYPSIRIGVAHKLLSNLDINLKTGIEFYTFKYKELEYNGALKLTTGNIDNVSLGLTKKDINIHYISALFSEGLRYNNILSYKKSNLFCSVNTNQRLLLQIPNYYSNYPSVTKSFIATVSANIGLNKQNNSIAIEYEKSVAGISNKSIDYKIGSLNSVSVNFAHKF